MNTWIGDYAITTTRDTITVTHKPTMSVAETTWVDVDVYGNLLDTNRLGNSRVLWFNRLFSRQPGQGIGGQLVDLLLNYCQRHNIAVICQVNAYGDLNQEELTDFYIRHGFERLPNCIDGVVFYPRRRNI